LFVKAVLAIAHKSAFWPILTSPSAGSPPLTFWGNDRHYVAIPAIREMGVT